MFDDLPDVRDGLTRKQRAVLWELLRAREEEPERSIRAALLDARVLAHVDMSVGELQRILQELTGRRMR